MRKEGVIKHINYTKVIKVAIGSTLAIVIANALGLMYSASAGIIALLSITDTKKDTIWLAISRLVAFAISTMVAYLLFETFGYTTTVFGVYIFCFMMLCCVFKLSSAVSLCAVLTTHYLAEQSMSFAMVVNESLLFLLGAGIGVVLNLYMPNVTHMIFEDMRVIEEDIKHMLDGMRTRLVCVEHSSDEEASMFERTRLHLEEAGKRAYDNMNNNLIADTRYYLQYIEMRKSQVLQLEALYQILSYLTYVPSQARELSEFIEEIKNSFHEYNNAQGLLARAHEIEEMYKQQEIPRTRIEFENRAMLYQVLQGLKKFLWLKQEFVGQLTESQIEMYWKEDSHTPSNGITTM